MSLIVAVRTRETVRPLHTTFTTALRSTDVVQSLLVEIEDADGAIGTGEAPAVPQVTGESVGSAREAVERHLAPVLIGAEAGDLALLTRRVRATLARNGGAKAAVDEALHDLAARRLGIPLVALLGGTATSIPTDVTLAAGEAAGLADAARARVADGFTRLKIKVGTAGDDVARVLAVREAVGPGVGLRLDANQGWDADRAIRTIRALEDAGADIELVEQPVPAADLEGLAEVTNAVDTPIMADESVFGVPDLVEVLRWRAADLVNVKLAKAGGLVPARTLLELAHEHGVGTMVGSMMETEVGVLAAASLAAAVGTTHVGDLDAAWWLADGTLRYEGGLLQL